MIKILILSFLPWLSISLPAQKTDCKVLKHEISEKYDGKCKDGLAHGKGKAVGFDTYEGMFNKGMPSGKGTYTWANGDTYTGEWEQGYRHGEGTLKFKEDGRDSVLTGMWSYDNYVGPFIPKPRVIHQVSVDRYTFRKSGGIKNRVLVNLYQNGMRNIDIENFTIASTSGTLTKLGESTGFDNIIFPVEIKVSYNTWNKVRAVRIYVVFEFEISEPADWVVDIHN